MFRIYYCIDINTWYTDKDDGFIRDNQCPQEVFTSESEAVNYFIKFHDCFLNSQKEILIGAGQNESAKEEWIRIKTENFFYSVKKDGTWKSYAT